MSNSLDGLTLLPASAGSGKTYTLTERLTNALAEGDVQAERILAVTFTEAAASELRGRIRARVLGSGDLVAAQGLDEAYISTIHGLGLRILKEFAFDLQSSIAPRLLMENEQTLLIQLALSRSDAIREIAPDLKRFGYQWTAWSGSEASQFRNVVATLIRLLRDLGEPKPISALADQCESEIRSAYGQVLKKSTQALATSLRSACQALLSEHPHSLVDTCANSKTAEREFRADYDNLRKAADTDAAEFDWSLWSNLRNLRLLKRGSPPLPDGYEYLATAVMSVAAKIERHPGPLNDAVAHMRALFRCAEDALGAYAEMKQARAAVDFTDMVTLAAQCMEQDQLAKLLAKRLDRIVVDEFQDTNPTQFSLIWHLVRQAVPAILVGDPKQSIMGFQGADVRLFSTLLESYPDAVEPLPGNWRSAPGVMDFINAASKGLFSNYARLKANAKASALTPLHVINFEGKRWSKRARAPHIADVIRRKLANPECVVNDRHTGKQRRARGSDVAILCPTNKDLEIYASALADLGLPAKFKRDGWFESEEVQIAWHALQLAADPEDRHAQLFLATSDIGTLDLPKSVTSLLDDGAIADPVVDQLRQLATGASVDVCDAVPHILESIGLFEHISQWDSARQARANLLAVIGYAEEFSALPADTLAAQGFHGKNLSIFVSWLLTVKDLDNTCPDAGVIEEDAVNIVTWHSSKGREWPIVVVCGWDKQIAPRLPDQSIRYPSFDGLEQLSQKAAIRFVPNYAVKEKRDAAMTALQPEAEDAARREIYVAISRAREQVVLEWPEAALASSATTRAALFATETSLTLDDEHVVLGKAKIPARYTHLTDADAAPDSAVGGDQTSQAVYGRALLQSDNPESRRAFDSISPSKLHEAEGAAEDIVVPIEVLKYADPIVFPDTDDPAALGILAHRFFEAGSEHLDQVRRCVEHETAALWGDAAEPILQSLEQQVLAFERALERELEVVSIDAEVDVIALSGEATIVSGAIDLVARARDKTWIIDHKTDRDTDPHRVAVRHLAQMKAYREMLERLEDSPISGAINLVRSGQLILLGQIR